MLSAAALSAPWGQFIFQGAGMEFSPAAFWPVLALPEPRFPLQQWVLSQGCLELGGGEQEHPLACHSWCLSLCKPGLVRGSLLAGSQLMSVFFICCRWGIPSPAGINPLLLLDVSLPSMPDPALALPRKARLGLVPWGSRSLWTGNIFWESCTSLMAWGPLVAGETGMGPGLAVLPKPSCLPLLELSWVHEP